VEKSKSLAIDIGNSQISVGWFENSKLTRREDLPTSTNSVKEVNSWISEVNRCFYASVVPSVSAFIEGAKEIQLADIPLTDLPDCIGIDRAVSVAEANNRFYNSVIVVNLGTATTIDLVTEEGKFLGGLIIPGVKTMLSSLSDRGELLPEVNFEPQKNMLGTSTPEAMLIGVQTATEGAIKIAIAKFKMILPEADVVLTGGWLAPLLDILQIKGKVLPDLTLEGIAHFGGNPGFN